MKMSVKTKSKVELLDITDQQLVDLWQLFERPGVEQVARELTAATCDAIATCIDNGLVSRLPSAVETVMGKTLSKYREYGAADSEGYQAVRALARKAQEELGVSLSYE